MSDHGVSNERKKELEQLDSFQAYMIKGLNFIQQYRKQCLLVTGALVAVVLVFSGIMVSLQRAEKSAALAVTQALTEYAALNDPEKGFEAVRDDFEMVFKEYGNTGAGEQARIVFAKICYDASQFDLSYEHYLEALDVYEDQAAMESLLLSALGHVCIAKKDYKAAQSYFKKVEKADGSILKDDALYSLALIADAAGSREKSRALYEKIAAEYGQSLYAPLARSKAGSQQ